MPGQGRLGDKANVPLDTHGCPACPHPAAIGPAIQGSPNVNVNSRPALRVDDPGMHAACCGTNQWTATQGSLTVFINGKAAHRMGDQNRHCGGIGQLVEGSPNVMVGESSGGGGGGSSAGSSSQGRGSASSSAGPQAAGSSGGGGGGGGASSGERAGAQNQAQAGGGAAAQQSQPPQNQADHEHVLVIKAQLQTPGGQPLAHEQVVLVKSGTDQVVAGPFTTDETGSIAEIIPEKGDYDIRLVDAEDQHHAPPADDLDAAAHLHCCFLLSTGAPASGEIATITGGGSTATVALGQFGDLEVAVAPGPYEIKVRDQTFRAHSIHQVAHEEEGGGYKFVIPVKDEVPDLENGRADRFHVDDDSELA